MCGLIKVIFVCLPDFYTFNCLGELWSTWEILLRVRKGGGGHLGHLINGRTFRREVCSVTDPEFWFPTIGPFYLCSRQNSDLLRKIRTFCGSFCHCDTIPDQVPNCGPFGHTWICWTSRYLYLEYDVCRVRVGIWSGHMVGPVLATLTFRQPSPEYFPACSAAYWRTICKPFFKLMLGYGKGTSVQVRQYSEMMIWPWWCLDSDAFGPYISRWNGDWYIWL